MHYLIFDDMTQCSEQEVARLLPLVSPQRREQALRFTHTFGQYCCLKSYELLLELYNEWCGAEHDCLPEFLYNEHGAPYWADGPYFSISHTKKAIAVAISDHPVGIDVEGMREATDGLISKAMNPEEVSMIQSSPSPQIEFIRLWTRKEAYVKMLGTGIISDMHQILVDTEALQWHEFVDIDRGYICTIVTKNE